MWIDNEAIITVPNILLVTTFPGHTLLVSSGGVDGVHTTTIYNAKYEVIFTTPMSYRGVSGNLVFFVDHGVGVTTVNTWCDGVLKKVFETRSDTKLNLALTTKSYYACDTGSDVITTTDGLLSAPEPIFHIHGCPGGILALSVSKKYHVYDGSSWHDVIAVAEDWSRFTVYPLEDGFALISALQSYTVSLSGEVRMINMPMMVAQLHGKIGKIHWRSLQNQLYENSSARSPNVIAVDRHDPKVRATRGGHIYIGDFNVPVIFESPVVGIEMKGSTLLIYTRKEFAVMKFYP